MRAFVWLDSWQQQCCGDDFQVGSTVQWSVHRRPDSGAWTDRFLDPEWAQRVAFVEDHHLGESDFDLSGVVTSIRVVTCDLELGEVADDPGPRRQVLVPVPGSGRLREVHVADKWEPEPRDEHPSWSFQGWLVEVDAEPAG